MSKKFDIPSAWEQIDFSELRGTILVVGAPDTGKSTFVQYLYQKLRGLNQPTAYLDGDPGQSSLGPPAALTAVFEPDEPAPADGHSPEAPVRLWRSFIGSVSPVGHMLHMLVGGARLVHAAQEAGANIVIYDTCGFVDPSRGGLALKLAKIDLLRPALVIAIQRQGELEPLLAPLRRSQRARMIDLQASPAARRRASPARQAHRARSFARYFSGAGSLQVDWSGLAVFPFPRFSLRRLVALEDKRGFMLNLGIITNINLDKQRLTLLTPQSSLKRVAALHLGDLELDLQTYRDRSIPL